MITVHKQILTMADISMMIVPEGTKFLHVAMQRNVPHIWYHCDTFAPMVKRRIAVIGTGHPAPYLDDKEDTLNAADYIGTLHTFDGELVFHVFAEKLPC